MAGSEENNPGVVGATNLQGTIKILFTNLLLNV